MKIHENSWKFTDINGSNNYAGRSLSWLFLVSIRLIYVTCLSLLHSTAYTVIMHPHVAWYAIVVQGQIFSQTGHKHFWEFMKIYGCLHDKPGTHVDPPKDVSVLSYGMSQCCSKPPQTQKKHTLLLYVNWLDVDVTNFKPIRWCSGEHHISPEPTCGTNPGLITERSHAETQVELADVETAAQLLTCPGCSVLVSAFLMFQQLTETLTWQISTCMTESRKNGMNEVETQKEIVQQWACRGLQVHCEFCTLIVTCINTAENAICNTSVAICKGRIGKHVALNQLNDETTLKTFSP